MGKTEINGIKSPTWSTQLKSFEVLKKQRGCRVLFCKRKDKREIKKNRTKDM
jgi:hypothetical protein